MQNRLSTFNILSDLIKGYRKFALVLFAIMVMAAFSEALGLTMILPILSGLMGSEQQFTGVLKIVDWIVSPFPVEYKALIQLCILVGAFLCKNILAVALRGLNAHFSMKLRELWSAKLLYRYLRDKYENVLEQKQGAMLHNAVGEPSRVSKSILVLLNLATKLILAWGITLMLLLVNWKMTLVLAAIAGLIYIGTKNVVFSYSVRFGKQRLGVNQDINSISAESLGAIKETKICGQESHYRQKLRKELVRFRKIQTKFSIFNHLPENLIEVGAVFAVALVIAFVHFGSDGHSAQLLSMTGFFVIAGQKLFNCLSYIISQRMKFASVLPGIRLIHEIITRPAAMEDLDSGETFDFIKDDIVFKNMDFSYSNGQTVFKGYNMRIPANKMTAIVGPSGSGKSTIADLLLGLLEPRAGAILVNSKNLGDYSLASWRKKVGYVGQDPVIFNASIMANIMAGRPDATEKQVKQAAKAASIHDFIIGLDSGYDTVVGDKGAKLSGGQRQRIVIARAIIRNPDIFIFDEATSALDSETEAAVSRAIDELAGEKTIVVIAHRLSTIKNADVIYDLGKNQ